MSISNDSHFNKNQIEMLLENSRFIDTKVIFRNYNAFSDRQNQYILIIVPITAGQAGYASKN